MFESALTRKLVRLALAEDLAFGDITSELLIPAQHVSSARILARERLVVCGLPMISVIANEMRADLAVRLLSEEGDIAKDGTVLAEISGKTRALLSAERTILNFIQKLSGIATHARALVAEAQGITLLDTRKTTPGWRLLEKYAVRIGGASNHRFSLGDMVLVKNNHIDAHGGDMQAALKDILKKKPRYMPMEIEVRDLAELKTALQFDPQVIMFDNMDDLLLRQSFKFVEKSGKNPLIEVSGGVNAARFGRLKKLGVSCVSMGTLTSKAVGVDISMRISSAKTKKPKKKR